MNIFVGNLAWGVDDVALQEAFEAHGEVERAKVIHDRRTGKSRGYGFIRFASARAVDIVLDEYPHLIGLYWVEVGRAKRKRRP